MGLLGDLFEAVGDFVGGVVETVAELGEEIVDATVDLITGGGSQLGNISSSSAKEISKMDAYDFENATKEETIAMEEKLKGIRKEYKNTLNSIEENTIKYSKEFIKKMDSMIETELNQKSEYDSSINPFLQREALEKEFDKRFESLNINVGDIKIKFNEAINNFKENFSSEILNHITIGDRKCKEIFKLENKKDKEKEIKKYFDELVDNALSNFCDSIDDISTTSLNSIKRNINIAIKNKEESLKNIKKEIEENMKLNGSEIEEKRKDYERKEKIINDLIISLKN